jgi:hypothetical protein
MKHLMKGRSLTALMSFAFVGLMILQYQNCSNYSDPSPFELNGDVSGASTSLPTQAKLDSPVGVLDLGEYDLNISVGGECNVGLAARHYIEIRLTDESNQPIPVREDTLCPKNGTGLNADCFRATTFRCEHGHYNIVLPVSCQAYRNLPTSLYRLIGQMVTYDDSGNEVRDTKASFERFFQIAWATGACP